MRSAPLPGLQSRSAVELAGAVSWGSGGGHYQVAELIKGVGVARAIDCLNFDVLARASVAASPQHQLFVPLT